MMLELWWFGANADACDIDAMIKTLAKVEIFIARYDR